MARPTATLCLALLTLLLSFQISTSADPPASSPSPKSDAPGSPIQPPPSDISSPPAPPPDSFPSPVPSPALPPSDGDEDDDDSSPSPTPYRAEEDAPSPAPAADDEESGEMKTDLKPVAKSEGGMSGGKKAGIAVGVLALVGLTALSGVVYKKRRENIMRAEYGSAARRDLL